MTIHNNIKIMNLVKNDMTEKWYRYMRVVTIFNAWDTTLDANEWSRLGWGRYYNI